MTQSTLCALVLDGQILRTETFDQAPPQLAPNKGVWLPIEDEPAVPAGDQMVVAETIFEADRVRRVETVVLKPLDQLKAEKRAAIVAACHASFAAGFTVTGGTLDGHVLQVQTAEDRTNWLALKDDCRSAIAAGNGAIAGATFRTKANAMFVLTWSEALSVLDAMLAWGKRQYANMWTLKDNLGATTTHAEATSIDPNGGWI